MMGFCNRSAREYVEVLPFHKDVSEDFVLRAKKILHSRPHEITTSLSDIGSKIKKKANEVFREIHYLSAYIRLCPYPEMLLVGNCKPEHQTGSLIAKSLSSRFNLFIILIFTENEFFIESQRPEFVTFPSFTNIKQDNIIYQMRLFIGSIINDRINLDMQLEEGDSLWKQYYETQFLEQRLNPNLFRKFIPKYALDRANMKLEKEFYEKTVRKNKKNSTMDSFL